MLPRLLFVLVLVVAPAVIYATSGVLPDPVASHFGSGGSANGWMPRYGYLWFISLFVIVMPVLVVAITGYTPQDWRRRSLFGMRALSAGEVKANPATDAWRRTHAYWLGIAMVVFLSAVHLFVVDANLRRPAQLAEPAFLVSLGVFAAVVILWSLALTRRMRQRR